MVVDSAAVTEAQVAGTLETAGSFAIPGGAQVRYRATQSIDLKPGFTVQAGADFRAEIGAVSCSAR